MQKESVKKIKLNEEQTKKFLSFFVPEAIELAKKKLREKNKLNSNGSENEGELPLANRCDSLESLRWTSRVKKEHRARTWLYTTWRYDVGCSDNRMVD
ncbi:hypothetical protein DNHGIG_07670 [Collibacillus ludicampi]|uniref:Transposase n=1 Tax=Collibacillus ludicampi TaxID=2771369 RepID=A0AAV4LBP1_9BACL|nr:hypothetical protein [Collibacillus ludicampi]GIM45218.1 hypothetical protein DNHGIG_07670 [Collibacillus ludicampi]